jgi:hypothetical protein
LLKGTKSISLLRKKYITIVTILVLLKKATVKEAKIASKSWTNIRSLKIRPKASPKTPTVASIKKKKTNIF